MLALLLPAALSGALSQQGTAFVTSGESGPGGVGSSVALSADGNTAAVGAPADAKSGAVFIYTRSAGVWSQQGEKLVPAAGQETGEGEFGSSVAISADGNTVLVGAPGDNSNAGAAWVFTRVGTTWSQQGGAITGSGEKGAGQFGAGVALSGEGNAALIGAPRDNSDTGSVWTLTRTSGAWSEGVTTLTGSPEEEGAGFFGSSVAISADGTTALVGAEGDSSNKGAGWVFIQGAGGWTQQGPKLTGIGESGASELGSSAALSQHGGVALLGGPQDDSAVGSVWAFARSGTTWSQTGGKLSPSDPSEASRFGHTVALSASGDKALVGGPFDGKGHPGAAWVFAPFGTGWSQLGHKTTVTESTEGSVSYGLGLSADGDTVVLGGPEQNKVEGAAWALVDPPSTPVTGTATGIATTLATLNGSLPPGPSANAYFQWGTTTAYGNTTAIQTQGLRTGPTATSLSGPLGKLAPSTTYHFRLVAENSGGTAVGADQTFTTLAVAPGCGKCCAPAKCPPPPCRPSKTVKCPVKVLEITNAAQSHKRWRRGHRAASIARRAPVGTTFSFALTKKARVRVLFTQSARGRRVHGHCQAPKASNRHHPACRRSLLRGSVAFTAHSGADRITFQGIVSSGATLPAGNYVATISASAGRETSNSVRLHFTIVR